MTLSDLAAALGGEVLGDPAVEISGLSPLDDAQPGTIVLAADARALSAAETGGAAAVLVPHTLTPRAKPAVRVRDARLAFARLLARFAPAPDHPPGIHSTAVLGQNARLDEDVRLGPYVVVGDGAVIGAGTVVMAGSVLGAGTVLGSGCLIYPHVTIRENTQVGDRVIVHAGSVIGSDGFGYAQDEGTHVKIPHLGRVVIEDDVEIGANSAIDRGTLGETRVGRGTKIDNLVQIAHNVRIGRATLIVGQAGVAGSATLGDGVILAGQAGIPDHITVGDRARVLARAVPTKDVPAGETVSGFPAQPHRDELRLQANLRRLPRLIEALEALQQRVEELAAGRRRPR